MISSRRLVVDKDELGKCAWFLVFKVLGRWGERGGGGGACGGGRG
jgi:hypothetical protein